MQLHSQDHLFRHAAIHRQILTVSFSFLAPLFYVKRIPQAEIRVLGTVDSPLRLERSSLEIDESPIFNKSIIKSTKVNQSVHHSKGNVEEAKRDVSLEEISADKGKKREKRKYNDRKIVEGNRGDQTIFGTRKKSMHSRETGRKDYFFFLTFITLPVSLVHMSYF